jgi:hypothetical protein
MTEGEQKKAFDSAVKEVLKGRTRIHTNTRDEIVRLLNLAEAEISATLLSQPTDYQRWALADLQFEINRILGEMGEASASTIGTAAGTSFEAGRELMDTPLTAAGGVSIVASLPRLDNTLLTAMREFMTDRIKDISVQAANKINSELGLVVIGAQAPGDAITRVRDILGEPSRKRAQAIVRTELGRVFSHASQQRMQQATSRGAPVGKKWLKSGKLHARLGHNLTHGQIVPVDQPFSVFSSTGGMPTKMMHPHDSAAPVKETINCGCTAVPTLLGEIKEYQSMVQRPDGDAWTKQQLRDQAEEFAQRNNIFPGRGVPAKRTITEFAAGSFVQSSNTKLEIGGTEQWFAIKQATGMDVGGYKTVLDSTKLKHVYKKHGTGNESSKAQRPVTSDDIAKIPDILRAFDTVSLTKTNRGLDALQFEKVISEENHIYIAEVRNGRKELAATTMYIKRKPRGGAMPK